VNAIPEPCKNDGSGFSKTGWNIDELRLIFATRVRTSNARNTTLVIERFFVSGCDAEKIVEGHSSCVPVFPRPNCGAFK
jgi:hypothetical protein